MHEPPLASPFGYGSTTPTQKRPSAPLLLKIGAGAEFGNNLIQVILSPLRNSPPAPLSPHWGVVISVAVWLPVYILIYLGLLRGSKISWTLIQLLCIFRIAEYLLRHSHQSASHPIVRVLPVPVSWLLIGIEVAFFIYLLSPQALRFFFKSKIQQ